MKAFLLAALAVTLVGCGAKDSADPGIGKAGPTVGPAAAANSTSAAPPGATTPSGVGPAADAKAGGYRSGH